MKDFRFLFAQNSINALSAIYLLEYLVSNSHSYTNVLIQNVANTSYSTHPGRHLLYRVTIYKIIDNGHFESAHCQTYVHFKKTHRVGMMRFAVESIL